MINKEEFELEISSIPYWVEDFADAEKLIQHLRFRLRQKSDCLHAAQDFIYRNCPRESGEEYMHNECKIYNYYENLYEKKEEEQKIGDQI